MHTTHGSPPPMALLNFTYHPTAPGLSFSVHTGRCVALLGIGDRSQDFASLSLALAGHIPVRAGSLQVSGENVTSQPAGHRKLATIGPHTPLFPHLSVAENCLFPLKARSQLSESAMHHRVSETLALTGLDAVRSVLPGKLTAEQTFRAQLARALILRPEAIVLDHPFTGLDHASVLRQIALLEKLQRAIGLSLLLLTHNRTEALLLGDVIGVMENGHLLQLGNAPTLLQRPASESVAVAFGEANVLTGKVLYTDDDCAELRLPSGETVEAMASHGLEEHDLAAICVPPDKLSVMFPRSATLAKEETEGMVVGTLVSARHLGTVIHIRFRMQDGGELIAHRPPVHTLKDLEPGRLALLAWQTANATAFPMDQKSG
ncbi:ABC transporter ATP-binding protein [Acetobacter tropicalis]|uniref:Spermidine/putrescine ABC transporter ATP-binding protein n=1 Tax=Acetobacter senegalensis TaxID=446692 RepID=A0A149TVL9_9PROT|nr:ABC transporter ATP-binding protein [Acetobacter senegalensis]KXV57213.1 spermidine/putrescine ABC transporter ATP-binding protein [Acetobacter senegalensis]MCG4257671.1 ABC transporter ATP-binding protein [Acetobacter senegalensis]MCG4261645.1 ABC transporter ATP-binding protein [Acetobacter senegalensis]MCG4267737.1 ABC transporter ATP-binding protein [Acetobacter senegalensis]